MTPDSFEATLRRPAEPPGICGWLVVQRARWGGEVADSEQMRAVASDRLGVPVEWASFSERRTTEASRTTLETKIGDELGRFTAESVDGVLHQHVGSSIHVPNA